jgi:heavy metal sensor kinase
MTGLSIRARLTLGYLAVLAAATLALTGGGWWLFDKSLDEAADASMAARLDGTRRFIDATEHQLPPEELLDEFQEFGNLTSGSVLLEVSEESGRVLCRPRLAGWDSLRPPLSSSDKLEITAREIAGEPYRAAATTLTVGQKRYHVTMAVGMSTAHAARRRFGWLLSALVPAVLIIAAAGGAWLSGRALAPVDRMTRDVRRISLRDPGQRLDVPRAGDELSRLASTFNEMLQRWQQSYGDMVRFTTDASHELRTPVSLARTTAELALARPRTVDEYQTALAEVLTYAERMSRLVNDLLMLARADAGVEAPAMTPIDLRDVARDAVAEMRPAFDRRRLAVTLALDDRPVRVSGSRESLRRLLVILLDNALNYTPSGGSVHVGVSMRPDGSDVNAVILVADTGVGVSAIDRPRVFDRFYRGSDARAAAPDGSGLGLSIAEAIVERHRGHIRLSDTPGGGCSVEVALPSGAEAGIGQSSTVPLP